MALRIGAPLLIAAAAFVSWNATVNTAGAGNDEQAQISADRPEELTASRGSARTEDFANATAPADEADPTTTTAAPVTTSTVVSTTTAVPATTTPPTTKAPAPKAAGHGNTQSGGASYYSYKAGGCAHKTIPKGTAVTVTNVANGKTATCVVNDRGPFVAGRIIDLDVTVFKQVASTSAGVFTARISW